MSAMRTPGDESKIVHHDEAGYAVASWRHVFIQVARVPVTGEAQRRVRRGLEAHWKRWQTETLTLVVIEQAALASVPAEVRDEGAAMAREMPSRAVAFVVEGSSFRMAAARTILAGLNMISRARYAQSIFSTLDEATKWLVQFDGPLRRGDSGDSDARALASFVGPLRG